MDKTPQPDHSYRKTADPAIEESEVAEGDSGSRTRAAKRKAVDALLEGGLRKRKHVGGQAGRATVEALEEYFASVS